MNKSKDTLKLVPTAQQIVDETLPVRETTLDRVYRENNVTSAMIAKQPRFTGVWEGMGGFAVAAEYLRGSEDPEAVKFMEVYDRVPLDEHDFLEFQGFCAAAGVSGKKIFGLIVAEAAQEMDQKIAMISAIKSPEVIDFTMEMAKTPAGHRERALVAKAVYLPRPKGSQTNIQINNASMGVKGAVSEMTLPAFDQDIRELGEMTQASMSAGKSPKMLEGKVEPGPSGK